MQTLTTIYDVHTTPDDRGMVISLSLSIMVLTPIAFFSWLKLRSTKSRSYLFPAALALVSGAYLSYRAIELSLWRWDLQQGNYLTLDGCVGGFHEELQREGRLGVDTFLLSGQRFTLSDSGWRLGYNTSRAKGSPIGPNAHIRAAAHGGHLLRIEVYPSACSGGPVGGA